MLFLVQFIRESRSAQINFVYTHLLPTLTEIGRILQKVEKFLPCSLKELSKNQTLQKIQKGTEGK